MFVTLFSSIKNTNPTIYARPLAVLEYIKYNEENRKKVLALRSSTNYKEEKLKRPCVAWAGRFSHRSNDGLVELSQLMYFDIDFKIPRKEIERIPEVLAIWESLSGRGWGFLVKTLNVTKSNYVSTYNRFIELYELPIDRLKDVARVNFISSDPNLYLKEDAKLFHAYEDKPITREYSNQVTFLDFLENNSLWFYQCNRALEKVLSEGLDYVPGSRHNFTVKFFAKTNFYGVPYDYAWNFLNAKYVLSEHSRKVSEDIYRRYHDSFGGIRRFARKDCLIQN